MGTGPVAGFVAAPTTDDAPSGRIADDTACGAACRGRSSNGVERRSPTSIGASLRGDTAAVALPDDDESAAAVAGGRDDVGRSPTGAAAAVAVWLE